VVNEQRRSVWTYVAVGLAIGALLGLYATFNWIIPYMNTVLFPWMAELEKRVPRSVGLVLVLVVFFAAWAIVIILGRRYIKTVRARLER
jgi:hypothetical protein